MIKLEGFSEDPKWIKSRISPALRVKTHHIETRLRNLIDQKVVDFNQGQYRVLNECLSSPNPYDPESFKIYRAGLRQVDQALEEISSYKPCNFFMGNLTIDAGLEREALDIFNRCRDQLLELEKKSHHPAKVLAISNNLITLVK
jgi:hypothetical protein